MSFVHGWPALLVAFVALPLAARTVSGRRMPRMPEVVRVAGDYCPDVEQRCLGWLPNTDEDEGNELLRCAEFAPSVCKATMRRLTFEIDRYEYPGRPGALPMVRVTWLRAQSLCERQGKRLCTEEEWTLACEGEKLLPYPYGYARDAEACNIDAPLRAPSTPSTPSRTAAHRGHTHWISPLDQREPSGSRPRCVSAFGVFDMTGNVDEWVDGRSSGHASSSMGGYWGPVRNRCRVVTRAHGETFSFYQTGFRCCRDVGRSSTP